MKAGADVVWADKTSVLTLSAYLLALTQWEQGHGWMHLSYQRLCRANPQPQAHVSLLLHVKGSAGVLAPRAGIMKAEGSEQCSIHRAEKKLHLFSQLHLAFYKNLPKMELR